ncbi:hypothetical protein DRN74_05580, partial [Candidatus Micrarchaeota archaeon]
MRKHIYIASVLLLIPVLGLSQQIITVPDDCATIQTAVNAVMPGGTVHVRPGCYEESITINKPIHLRGEDPAKTVIESPDLDFPVITIAFDTTFGDVIIENLAVKKGYRGFLIANSAGTVRIRSCVVALNETGVLVRNNNAIIEDCFVWGNASGGIVLWPAYPTPYAHFLLQRNEIYMGHSGIVLRLAGELEMYDNTIAQVGYAVNSVSPSCGWHDEPFGERLLRVLVVRGENNRIHALRTLICPPLGQKPWPDGFLVQGFHEAVSAALAHLFAIETDGVQPPAQSLSHIDAAIEILQKAPLPPLLADLYTLKASFLKGEDPEQAIEVFLKALVIVRERGMDEEIALISQELGALYLDQERYEEAYAYFAEAAETYLLLGDELKAAAVKTDAGIALAKHGRLSEALELLKEALTLYERNPVEAKELARLWLNLGTVLSNLGRCVEALEMLQRAKAVFSQDCDWESLAICEMNIGVAHASIGHFEEAISSFEKGRKLAEREGLDLVWAKCTANIATAYLELGEYGKAISFYRKAYNALIGGSTHAVNATLLLNMAVALWYANRLDEAYACLVQARSIFEELKMESAIAEVSGNLGILLAHKGEYEEALKEYNVALRLFSQEQRWPEVATTQMNIGIALEGLGRDEEALTYYEAALASLNQVKESGEDDCITCSNRWIVYYNKGRCFENLGYNKAAIETYLLAIKDVELIRRWLKREELKLAWGERTKDVYEHLIDLLYRMGQGDSAFLYAERCRARIFLDILYGGGVEPSELVSPEAGFAKGTVDPKAIEE